MGQGTVLIAVLTFLAWGVSGFFGKISASKIGDRSVFWDLLGYFPAVLIYCLAVFRFKNLFEADKSGAMIGLLAGVLGSIGIIGFYYLLTRADSSTVVPLTALYPSLTAILAFVFLREVVTIDKIIGIALSVVAIYFLSK